MFTVKNNAQQRKVAFAVHYGKEKIKKKTNQSVRWPTVVLWDTSCGAPVNRIALLNQRRQLLYNKLY